MIFSQPRKRSRDVEDDFDLDTAPLGKRSRAVTDDSQSFPTATRPWLIPRSPLRMSNTADMTDSDFNSTASEAGSTTTDDSMDLDLAPSRNIYHPQPTALSSSWSGPSTWATQGHPPRRADSLLSRPVRPKPYPLQSSHDPRGPPTTLLLQRNSGMNMSMSATPTLNTAVLNQQNSPQESDEPYTPTTMAGSQLELLSVNDMDIDSAPSTPSLAPLSTPLRGTIASDNDPGSFIRRQRQRSGAFISSPSDAAKRFQMGYRDDCEKCRDRVPGHMNHFIGT